MGVEAWRSEFSLGHSKFKMPVFNRVDYQEVGKLLMGGKLVLYQFRT